MSERPSTPPARRQHTGRLPPNPLTPEQVRRTEEARLKAKAIRQRDEAAYRAAHPETSTSTSTNNAGTKRPFSSVANIPPTQRDATASNGSSSNPRITSLQHGSGLTQPKDDGIRPAKKFQKTDYIEYDFSAMTDTKGGFLSVDDDPYNRAMAHKASSQPEAQRPAGMSVKEWERMQLLRKLRMQKAGPFEPGISALDGPDTRKKCRECGSLEIDFQWEEVFGIGVCNACKESLPERYSLLTKTEAREDYLLTDPELKDEKLLPRLERPNPHKSTWNNMQLYLRFQVEEYAFSERKWGSPEALDKEFEKRQEETKRRKDKKFKEKLADLKKRTLFDAHKRQRATMLKGEGRREMGEATFGARIEDGKHVHEWGRSVVDQESGMSVKKCVDCGMEVEELEF